MRELRSAVRQARTERRWSQAALAATVGLNERTVARIEAGTTVSRASVDAVARELGIDVVGLSGRAVADEPPAPEPERVPDVPDTPHVAVPAAVDEEHLRRRQLLIRVGLANRPGAEVVASDVPAFDAAAQLRAPTRHVGSEPAERVRRAVRDRTLVDFAMFALTFLMALSALYPPNAWAIHRTTQPDAVPLVGALNMVVAAGFMVLMFGMLMGGGPWASWPLLRRFHDAARWTERSVRLRDRIHVVRGSVLTRLRIEDGDVEAMDIRLDAWTVDVVPQGPAHATVTLRADGRCDEVLDFVPVGPALDALLAAAAPHVRLAA